MSETYLTAKEILEIDNLNPITLPAYLENLPSQKHDLVIHLFSKNNAHKKLQVIYLETKESHDRLVGILREKGISYA